ncbi:MAG: hypothetical protein KGL46_04040 [Hyphomicrobiales bacterium]|nr:hypothetical protein [Hyphomicrobiales bacterium]
MPGPQDHVHMIRRGWRHADLMRMELDEAAFWLGQQIEYDKAVAQAIKDAQRS